MLQIDGSIVNLKEECKSIHESIGPYIIRNEFQLQTCTTITTESFLNDPKTLSFFITFEWLAGDEIGIGALKLPPAFLTLKNQYIFHNFSSQL